MTGGKRKRVCVVGSGAAGMACAWSLGRFPDRFEVEVWEALPQPGGVATSQSLRSSKDGANLELNDQVQVRGALANHLSAALAARAALWAARDDRHANARLAAAGRGAATRPRACAFRLPGRMALAINPRPRRGRGRTAGARRLSCARAGGLKGIRRLRSTIPLARPGRQRPWHTDSVLPRAQGGAPSYRNNVLFFQEFGCKTHSVMMKVCFGKGEFSWTNHADSALVQRLHKDIERFGRVLKWIHRFEPLFVFFPIHRVSCARGARPAGGKWVRHWDRATPARARHTRRS